MTDKIPVDSFDPFNEKQDNFLVARATAIREYAGLEQSLCRLFAHLAGLTDQVAGIIFFKMVNARSRVAVMERPKHLKYDAGFSLYFNSVMKAVGNLDGDRNKIVHWGEAVVIKSDGEGHYKDAFLVPPNFWDWDEKTPSLSHLQIVEFCYKCDFFARALNGLTWHWIGHNQNDAWLDIFERELSYPPPEDHPLIRTQPAPAHPPPSSSQA